MQDHPQSLFAWMENAGERVAEGSLPWVLGAWFVFTVGAYVALRVVALWFRWAHRHIAGLQGSRIRPIRYRGQEIFSEQEVTLILVGLLRYVRYAVNVVLAYAYLTFVFGLFPATRALASSLLGYFTSAAHQIGTSMLDYLPSLAFLVVLTWVTRAIIRLMRMAFERVETGRVRLARFPAEFAMPTFRIARALAIVFAIIVAYPYLPGSGSAAFQAVSIFVGLLVSLGSSGAIANVVSGMSLTYMRAFKVGDRVRIADAEGDIIDKTTFVTKVRTTKNVEVTIPNTMVMANHIVNYSGQDEEPYLILHTTVTIGFDVDWRLVHELMVNAALEVDGIEADPAPYVLQTSLDDFYVHYELNAHTKAPRLMSATYSELHAKIQDAFHSAGIEIASPHLSAMRDGNRIQIPDPYLPQDYQPASFRVLPLGGERFKKSRQD
jgi:small-conductance mechanosensitive channel